MSGGKDRTPEERLDLLRGLLSGTRSDSRAARNMARMENGNVMFAAMLHAADRLRAGEPATDLEEQLLQVLRVGLSEGEIKDWGRVYREALTARGGNLTGVSGAVTGLPVTEGYTVADWARDAAALGDAYLAQSNTSLIDREAWAAGEAFDSPEFIEGMREWGFGVTVPASVPVDAEQQAVEEVVQPGERAAQPFGFKLEFENFHVHRVVGDGWPNTRE
ncbi:hypothetical protein ACFWFB_32080, partial [Streptomyces albidoflavus]